MIGCLPFLFTFCAFAGGFVSKTFINCKKSKEILIIFSIVCMGGAAITSLFNLKLPDQIQTIAPFLPALKVNWEININHISSLMTFIVTLVSCLVHCYSYEYMREDSRKDSFFCFLSLFTLFMLILVYSGNFVQLFVGWEGVGLCSYLLIGFFRHKESACNAAIKAFITNRIGDAGLLVGMALIFMNYGHFNFAEIFANLNIIQKEVVFFGLNWQIIDWICIFLFIGCMGKSAQIVLHVWLPDAMEGPTPVSALIHAATMVTAGVFLLTLCHEMLALSSVTQNFIMFIGGATIIFAGSIAIFQDDIKKIIAYSTCSQLGYMILGCGALIFEGSMFHLTTHAFFKAMLFLGAGTIIHHNHHEQNIMKLPGNLYAKMPLTMTLMLIGTMAIVGIPPLAGFFSKDFIIEGVIIKSEGNLFAEFGFFCAIWGALLTSLYSWRLIFFTFFNNNEEKSDIKEANWIMSWPVVILAVGAIFAGLFGVYLFNFTNEKSFLNFLTDAKFLHTIHETSQFVKLLPLLISIIGFILAFYLFFKKRLKFPQTDGLCRFFINKYYVDEIYHKCLLKPVQNFAHNGVKSQFEKHIGRGLDNRIICAITRTSSFMNSLQNGRITLYVLIFVCTLFFLMIALMLQ